MTTFNTSREIPAPVEQVFAAISDPERLARWWGPAGFTNTFSVCEFTNGGRWSFIMHGPDGRNYPNENEFAEIGPPHKVVVQHTSEPEYRLTISLTSTAEGTVVSWSQAFENSELARRIESVVVPANEQNLERLAAEVLQGTAAAGRTPPSPEKLLRKRPLTFILIALAVAWTVWIMFSGKTGESWRRFGISNGFQVFDGDYWTVFFSIFVHLGLLHLFFNTYWLYILGGYVEERYGWKFYALLVLVSGACGSVLELSFAGNTGVGFSGVVYAVFGLLWGVKMFGKESMPLLPAQTIQVFMIWLVLCIFTTASGLMSVGNVAHVTGLVLGLLTARSFYSKSWAVRSLSPLVVAFCVLALFYSPWSKEWLASKALRAHQAHRWDAAEEYYSKLLTLDPGDFWALENRGRIRLLLGNTAEGKADLNRAEELKSHEK